MLADVEKSLATIWPTLKLLLLRHKKTDRFLIHFGMNQAKAGAWKFEKKLATLDSQQPDETIKQSDKKWKLC